MNNMLDDEIIELYFSRSENAVKESENKYSRYCGSIAFHILGDSRDAEECVSDAFLAAWNNIPPERPKNLRVYLGRLTRNISLNRFDYKTAKKRRGDFDSVISELDTLCGDTVEKEYDNKQIANAISGFLRSVSEEQRKIFILRYWYAYPIADIVSKTGMSESKIKSMLLRLRKKLKDHLEKEDIYL